MSSAHLWYACALVVAAVCANAQPVPVRLWPGDAPGEKAGSPKKEETSAPGDHLTAGRPIVVVGNVTDPTLAVYKPAPEKDTGTTVVVFPGGGYYILAFDLEGTEACAWLNSVGVTAVLVKYRVPRREGLAPYAAPLQDAQRAVGIVRARAAEWGLDPKRIGVMGFSAGGNLCAVLSSKAGERTYPRVDGSDDVSCRPDFQLLIYPAYLVPDNDLHTLAPEVAVNAATPPSFMVMAVDDPIHVENVLSYSGALKEAKVPFELHVYPQGGHGYGLRPDGKPVTSWPSRAEDWLRSRGLLGGK
jgi:acetyl esterase/lipase